MSLSDQPHRDRFISEVRRNFAVVAPAGVGKTHAIVKRIISLSRHSEAKEILPKLVVVTFANRAAEEMQRRVRTEILNQTKNNEVISAFNQAFFGTIHSFCVRLLQKYGHHLGLPTFDVITDDDEVWNEFVQQLTTVGRSLSG